MRKIVDQLLGIRRRSALFAAGVTGIVAFPSSAQVQYANRGAICSADRAAIYQLSTSFIHMVLWDEPTLGRARASLSKLQQSRTNVIRLTRRLNGAKEWAVNAEAFDKSGEANLWRRDASEVRAAIATENKKAKALAGEAGVSCSGCRYSVLIAKVEAAINAAISARAQAAQAQQRIARYRSEMATAGCRD